MRNFSNCPAFCQTAFADLRKVYEGKNTTTPAGMTLIKFSKICPSSATYTELMNVNPKFTNVLVLLTCHLGITLFIRFIFNIISPRTFGNYEGLQILFGDDVATRKGCNPFGRNIRE